MRSSRSALAIVVSTAVACLSLSGFVSQPASAADSNGSSPTPAPAGSTENEILRVSNDPVAEPCGYGEANDTSTNIPDTTETKCTAGFKLSRRGVIKSQCFWPERQGQDYLYYGSYCSGRNAPIELIAQSRFIYRLSHDDALMGQIDPDATGSGTGISPDIQWEVRYPAKVVRNKGGFESERVETQVPDVLVYDEAEGTNGGASPSDLYLAELKVQCDYQLESACTDETKQRVRDKASKQLTRYVNSFPNPNPKRDIQAASIPTTGANGYTDTFRLTSFCKGGTTRTRKFEVRPAPQDEATGVLEVYTVEDTGPCAPAPEVSTDGVAIEEPQTPVPGPEMCPGVDPEEFALLLSSFGAQLMAGGTTSAELSRQLSTRDPRVLLALKKYLEQIMVAKHTAELAEGIAKCFNLGGLGVSSGDPHLGTMDGIGYDLQGAGEFHLVRSTAHDFDVQARFVPLDSKVSITDRVAFDLNSFRVELTRSGKVFVDGEELAIPSGEMATFGDDAFILNIEGTYTVFWPGKTDKPIMQVRGHAVRVRVPASWTTSGLLGNNNGNPSDDFALRDGTSLGSNPTAQTIHGSFADSWRITQAESLFTYASGQSTQTFTDRSFPAQYVTAGDFTDAEVAAATKTCADAGVVPGVQFDGCVIDVLQTGDDTYAAHAALATDTLVAPDAAGFDAQGRLAVDFENAVPSNFTALRYSSETATTRIAGPLFDGTGYRFAVGSVPRHDQLNLQTDLYVFGPVTTDSVDQSVAITINGATAARVQLDGSQPTLTDLADGVTGTVTQTGSGTAAGGHPYVKVHLALDLPPAGEALPVSVDPTGFRGVFNTSLGVDNLTLQLQTPTADAFTVSEPLTVPGTGHAHADGAGRLESRGAADQYTFTVPAATADAVRVIDTTACDTKLTYQLTSTSTGATLGRWPNTCGRVKTPPLPAGGYQLEVSSYANSGTGSYDFDLFPVPTPDQFSYDLGAVVTNGHPETGAGNLETVASSDIYTFTTTSAGDFFLDTRGCLPQQTWMLRTHVTSGNGTVVASGICEDKILPALPAGSYDLEFGGDITHSGAYGFQAYPLPVAPQDFTPSLPMTVAADSPATGAGRLETQKSVDRYAFSVTDAAPLYVDIQSCLDDTAAIGDDGAGMTWSVVDTSDESVKATGGCSDAQTPTLNPGSYLLEVASAKQGIGTYELQAWLVPVPPQTFALTLPATIGNGQPATGAGNLETKASQDIYNFTLPTSANNVYLEQVNCTKPNMLHWELHRSLADLHQVIVATGGCNDQIIRRLAGGGTYQLIVNPVGEAHGTYSMRVSSGQAGAPAILHVPQTTAFYGKDIPIQASTTCATPANPAKCYLKLAYRTTAITPTSGALNLPAGEWTVVNLTQGTVTAAGSTNTVAWSGKIPGTELSTTGVDYYLLAGDGENRNEFPAAASLSPMWFTDIGTLLGATAVETPYLHVATLSPPLVTHVPALFAQADTDLPITVQATCSTGNCTATLHYRTTTGDQIDGQVATGSVPSQADLLGDPGWPTKTMTQTNPISLGDLGNMATFTATIPGSIVDTRGVDYYISVTDSHTTTYWPGTSYQGYYAPTDGMRTAYQTVHVLERPHIVHVAPTSTNYKTATVINATSNCPKTRTCTARLYYRTTVPFSGTLADSPLDPQDFASVPMSATRIVGVGENDILNVTGTIPAAVADTRGIDYYFRIDDGSTTTWFPGTGQISGYVNVDGLKVGYVHVHVNEPPHITHIPTPTAKPLQPYTITSKMSCVTPTCSLTLHWRNDLAPGETSTGWHNVTMTPTGLPTTGLYGPETTYTATIPAAAVTTRGLAYYLEGFDGHVHVYAPGTSYWGAYYALDGQHLDVPVTAGDQTLMVGAFQVRVLEPPHVVHAPPIAVPAEQPISLTATSNCSSPTCSATLTWTDHNGDQQTVPMTAVKANDVPDNPALGGTTWRYTATIPAEDAVGTPTYNITATDGYTTGTSGTLLLFTYQ